jgi:programmed cell death protein 5
MDELEAIRARKLQQLQAQQNAQQEAQKQLQVQQALRQIDGLMRKFLTPQAQDRLMNLSLVEPELVQKLKIYLAQLFASGQIKQMDDSQLKEILIKLKSSQKEFTIKRLSK